MASCRLRLHRPSEPLLPIAGRRDLPGHRRRQRNPGTVGAPGPCVALGLLVQADTLHANRSFLYLEQRGANFLIAVKHRRLKGFQMIKDRLTYGRPTPIRKVVRSGCLN